MLRFDNKTTVLKVFFDDPLPEFGFQLRQLGRICKLAPLSVKNYLDELQKDNLIIIKKHPVNKYPLYYPNRDDEKFRMAKRLFMQRQLYECGLIDHIYTKCLPQAIILFGSTALGEDVKESDIDLCVISGDKKLELAKFEGLLSRKINIIFRKDFGKISKELKNNIINGIILKGYLKVF